MIFKMSQIIKIVKDVPLTNVVADIEHLFSEICERASLALEPNNFPALTITGTPSASTLDAATLGGNPPDYYDISLHSISDLSDVDTTGVSDGYILTWNGLDGKWKPSASISDIGDILNVEITNPSNKEILVYKSDTENWVNSTLANAGIVSGPESSTDGNAVVFNGTTGKVVKDAGFKPISGPTFSIDGELAVFNGITGKIIKGTGFKPKAPLNSPITVTVGSGGDFPTINSALAHVVSTYYPVYLSTAAVPRVTIRLLSGFVMSEQVLIDSLDLSWITITGVDAETVINRSALTRAFGQGYPAFAAINGGFLPIIGQLFNMDTSGTASDRHGILAYSNSRAIVLGGCGVKNAGTYGIFASNGSTINAGGADASGAGTYGIFAYHSSTINAGGADASGAGSIGIFASNGSIINANGATGTLNLAKNTLTGNGIIFQS